jgi:peptidoglycan hydrolase-like protein with peptidoglycan-binding domain
VLALLLSLLAAVVTPQTAAAQDGTVWLQIEAQPSLTEGQERARAYAALFPETAGFRLRSGWYGIVLGPYPADEAQIRLDSLKREGLIPPDSFIAFERNFGTRFWPPEGAPLPEGMAPPEAEVAAETPPATEAEPALIPDETRAEARDSEALLTEDQRKEVQVALQWFGFYQGGIDGAFGPGTRNSMAAWQEAQGMLEPTGILTSRQRAELLRAWRDETAAFGFAEVVEAEAGITITLPLGLVEFDHYEPPFVHFRARNAAGPQIILISQPGDQAAFAGLYDVLQTLESVPLTGERNRGERTFRIRGTSDRVDTTVFAELKGGLIKGWMLISSPGNEARDGRILRVLESSFAATGDRALDPGMVAMGAETRAGLLSGLEIRKPRFSRSGLFVSADGAVLTTLEAVEGCGRVTLDRTTDGTVSLTDPASGLALVLPKTPLSPRKVAEFQLAPERVGTEVMVAGYSYEDRLPAPVMTFGTLEEVTGLNGEPGLKRLSVQALPGDTGGPVLDATGAVIGMLLPGGGPDGKALPPGTFFALAAAEIARVLAPSGIVPAQAARQGALPPADLSDLGTGMTVLVSCWD